MQFMRRFTYWTFSGPQVWITIGSVLFITLLVIYKSLISSTDILNDYISPDIENEMVVQPHSDTQRTNVKLFKYDEYISFINTNILKSLEPVVEPFSSVQYVIKSGDTLARIFTRFGLSRKSMYAVLDADQEYLVLEPLLPKDQYTFKLNDKGELMSLTRRIDISKSVSFVRHGSSDGFSYEEHITPIVYTQRVIHSKIVGSFYDSAKKVGLSDSNILTINEVLNSRVDFRKDLRRNDEFDLILKTGSINGTQVGSTQLEALQMTVKGQIYRAFLHSDGRFYDQDGNSLTPSLRRWPTTRTYRVSSPFNANRLHPITGHLSPHNGVDLATPTGTKVLATGDGVVTRIANHKYAGKYIVIDYNGPYGSRFLHLSKILVRKGQHVKRGQVIALSGNTGRSTGAHLHYELHVRGKPANPMTTAIPTTKSISAHNKAEYQQHVTSWINMMTHNDKNKVVM